MKFQMSLRYLSNMTTKTCFKCLVEKDVEEFYKHPAMGDGRLGKCKECAKKDVHDNYIDKRPQYSQYEQERNKDEARKANKRRYEKQHKLRNPEKKSARQAVGNAVRDGRLKKMPCEICGNTKTQAHHEDYLKPLDVRWLCFKCHREHEHGQVVLNDEYWENLN